MHQKLRILFFLKLHLEFCLNLSYNRHRKGLNGNSFFKNKELIISDHDQVIKVCVNNDRGQ